MSLYYITKGPNGKPASGGLVRSRKPKTGAYITVSTVLPVVYTNTASAVITNNFEPDGETVPTGDELGGDIITISLDYTVNGGEYTQTGIVYSSDGRFTAESLIDAVNDALSNWGVFSLNTEGELVLSQCPFVAASFTAALSYAS